MSLVIVVLTVVPVLWDPVARKITHLRPKTLSQSDVEPLAAFFGKPVSLEDVARRVVSTVQISRGQS